MLDRMNKKIDNIAFGLLSPTEIRKMSVTSIITPDTYGEDGFPIDMGLMDARLGVMEPSLRCKTCGRRVSECPGHFGHIDMAMPVIHVGYTKILKDLLSGTCRKCNMMLLTKEEISNPKGKKAIIKTASSKSICPHCGEEQRPIILDKPTTFREGGQRLTPVEIRQRLEQISDEDLTHFGIDPKATRPEWMVLTVLPVPPVAVRPSITLETGERSEDDLTHKLADILRINRRLRENRDVGAPQLIVEDLWDLLQYHITTYLDNQAPGIPPARHRSGRQLKTLAQRLRGKEGRFRSNLSGKRVDYSARTVITPDPNISINEVGIPIDAAKILTVSNAVNEYNMEMLKEIVRNGPNDHPGANYIVRPDGARLKISEKNKEQLAERLAQGFTVERHLIDGDIVIFNRQPSLHRMSMMAHRVKVLPYHTFRLNLTVCPPYNADFDGDEMNLHVPQSAEAIAEAKILMMVQENIISPRFGGPVIGCLHDQISGAYLLTRGEVYFDLEECSTMLGDMGYRGKLPEPKIIDGKKCLSGKELFSLLLPEDLNMEFKASICNNCKECKKENCDIDAYVMIKDGKLMHGTIDEKAIGVFKGALIDKITRDYGKDAGREFLDTVSKLIVSAIMIRGFGIGLDDYDILEETSAQIEGLLTESEERLQEVVRAYKSNELEPLPGRTILETLEMDAMKILGRARDRAGEITGEELGLDNTAVIMASSGARGSPLNLTQMAAIVGQQAVRGERISRGYHGRTLSHFKKDDLGSKAKGFVRASFKEGMNLTEYFFHSMGGREGLVDTAVRTSHSGYLQRRLINAMIDLSVDQDLSVKDSAGNIIQFRYGEDGIDPTKGKTDWEGKIDEILAHVTGG